MPHKKPSPVSKPRRRPAPPPLPKHRLYVTDALAEGQALALSEDHAHYLGTVMRAGLGDKAAVFNGRDGEWTGVIEDIGKRRCTLRLESQLRPQEAENQQDLWLIFAPVKKAGTDMIVEKATELGVAAMQPVITKFTQSQRINLDRMRANAGEAAEQCERLSVPEVFEPVTLEKLIADWPAGRILFALDETGGGAAITDIMSCAGSGPSAFLVGPEGGFAKSELDLLRRSPFVTHINLGPRILRAETAAVAGLTCWQALCGDWRARPSFRTPFHAPE
jgi:16S rRNA (uracil1498-N3)-methyltransferase